MEHTYFCNPYCLSVEDHLAEFSGLWYQNNFENEETLLNTFSELINTNYVFSVLQFKLMDYLLNKVTE